MDQAEFGNRGLLTAPGRVVGSRWWWMDSEIVLTGAAAWRWRSREMTAHCIVKERVERQRALNPGWQSLSRYADVLEKHPLTDVIEAPAENCSCGIYAFWRTDDEMPGNMTAIPVLGTVEGWGRTVIGTRGFRSQHARILGLCLPPGLVPDPRVPNRRSGAMESAISVLRTALERIYNVPTYATPDELAEAHPTTTDYLEPAQ